MRKEEAEERKRAKELKDSCNKDFEIVYCRYCSAPCPGIFNVCDNQKCLNKMNEGEKNSEDKKNNNSITEREREREKPFSTISSSIISNPLN
jgi:hypothetical protein